ncbi:MAG: rRNA maturation RNase YbeY [Candidatus Omnitrophica bacterium]|nr:rRNA maturation RNase YbeY [Candidatus Omnitrophota bacterium]
MPPERFQIQITSTCRRMPCPESVLKKTISKIFKRLKIQKAELSLFLVGDRRMRSLNKRFLNHDWTTDVISFDLTSGKSRRSALTGELIISLETARRQAAEFDTSFRYELYFYICHGILHILGYDDKTQGQRGKMLQKQAQILRQIGISK